MISTIGRPMEQSPLQSTRCRVYSPALRALVDELASIVAGFDHSGDDITNRYFGRVRVEDTTVVW
ncbi:hypothetical protein [Rhodococcus sp. IEGM1428]|uniref:hypothetical protein n=1 Tax=Rhodococcus sp. IEGM1428 TaxID=3392191 RepID=UPI003D0DA7DD